MPKLLTATSMPVQCANWSMNTERHHAMFEQTLANSMRLNTEVFSDTVRPKLNFVIQSCAHCKNDVHINPFKKRLIWQEMLCDECNAVCKKPTVQAVSSLNSLMYKISDAFIASADAAYADMMSYQKSSNSSS